MVAFDRNDRTHTHTCIICARNKDTHKRLQIENKSKQSPFMYVTQHKQWCSVHTLWKIVQNFVRFLSRCTNKLRTNEERNQLILNAFNGCFSFRFASSYVFARVLCAWKLHTKLAGKQRPFMCNKMRANFEPLQEENKIHIKIYANCCWKCTNRIVEKCSFFRVMTHQMGHAFEMVMVVVGHRKESCYHMVVPAKKRLTIAQLNFNCSSEVSSFRNSIKC